MESSKPKPPIGAIVIYSIVALVVAFSVGKLVYDNGFNDGMVDERQYIKKLLDSKQEDAGKVTEVQRYIDNPAYQPL